MVLLKHYAGNSNEQSDFPKRHLQGDPSLYQTLTWPSSNGQDSTIQKEQVADVNSGLAKL